MEAQYQPESLEQTTYKQWEDMGVFKPAADPKLSSFSLMIPPPNVTGTLHMGHAFQNTIMDAITRHQRMLGKSTLWQVGTDHAGIATQMVVERQLAAKDQSRYDLGREAFIDKVWDWKAQSGGSITQQLRRLGSGIDWSRERFTMDEGYSKAVKKVFVDLFNEGLIYRGKRLVNWDPVLQTAISDLEVINEPEQGSLWHIKYTVAGTDQTITIATTRPETLLGDSAVAVHPEDERYTDLVGKMIDLPLCNRTIPIVADDYVDQAFGTGCVKITPAHDFNDYEVGQRHKLPLINILTSDGKINEEAPEAYQGLDRFEARKQLLIDLEAAGFLEKEEPHTLNVPRGDRSGTVIEPFLTNQWYVKVESLAKPAIEAVENGDIEFVPKNWENTYFAWMRDLKDWCISRQLWWGHQIPAFYDTEGKVYVGETEAVIRAEHNIAESVTLTQDEDVLDTWFSSALWTFATLGWPEQTPDLERFHSTDVLVTGFDIIFFWVARMIMMTLKFTGKVPFKKVYVHGLVRDGEGQKMSKSKGNVLDPIDLIDGITLDELVEKRTFGMMQPQKAAKITKATKKEFAEGINSYGTDALRLTFCSLASTGRDIRFDMGRITGYRNYCNKLWNATRFVLMNTEDFDTSQCTESLESSHVVDQWIVSKLQRCEQEVAQAFANFRFDIALQAIYDFSWNSYCDWYLELTKGILVSATPEQKIATQYTMLKVLETIQRLLHPMAPFITNSLWLKIDERLGDLNKAVLTEDACKTVALANYPIVDESKINASAEQDMEWLQQMIIAIRNIRGELNISPAKALPVLLQNGIESDKVKINIHEELLSKLARIETITWLSDEQVPPLNSTQVVGDLAIRVPLKGLIDVAVELERVDKQLLKLEKTKQSLMGKLSNEKFVANAPKAVVEADQAALKIASEKLDGLLAHKQNLQSL